MSQQPSGTGMGWTQVDGYHELRKPVTMARLLTSAQALGVVNLNINRPMDVTLWERFCSPLVTVIGVEAGADALKVFKYGGPHRVAPGRDRPLGFEGSNFEKGGPFEVLGYDPVSVAELRDRFDASALDVPNIGDSMGKNVWLLGTDKVLNVRSDALLPEKKASAAPPDPSAQEVIDLMQGPMGQEMREKWKAVIPAKELDAFVGYSILRYLRLHGQASDEAWLKHHFWPSDMPEAIEQVATYLVDAGILRQLAPAQALEAGFPPLSPLFELRDDLLEQHPEWLRSNKDNFNRSIYTVALNPLGQFGEFRDRLLASFRYKEFHEKRRAPRDKAPIKCKAPACAVMFVPEHGNLKFCPDHRKGSPGFETARKQARKAGR